MSQNLVDVRKASLMDGDYALQGDVYLELYDDNSLNLRFDTNYLTQTNVFDVHVFLTNNNDYTTPIDTTGMLLVENIGTISGLNYSSGAMTFNLPSGVGINDYGHIVLICMQFGQLHWGDGVFNEIIPTNVSEGTKTEANDIKIFPNPSVNGMVEVQFQDNPQDVLVELLNMNGQVVYSERIVNRQQYFVELNDPGIYFLSLTSDSGKTVRKVIRH
ncbi:MAG: T9SS type A sorting domain-containing protein [Salibacteraceae bacterium]